MTFTVKLKNQNEKELITLTVFFSGTSHKITSKKESFYTHLASCLYEKNYRDNTHLNMGFDGCGIKRWISGFLFGVGCNEQASQVYQKVLSLLEAGNRVKINAYGHSRGGISCLLLAKKLALFDPSVVSTNLVLMDPVPGNFFTATAVDCAGISLAKQCMDLSHSLNLNNVLALYTNQSVGQDLIGLAHAPIVPKYPNSCKVEEEIIPGCHSGAQYVSPILRLNNNEQYITFQLVYEFLVKHGSIFNDLSLHKDKFFILDQFQHCLDMSHGQEDSRQCHSLNQLSIKTSNTNRTYFSMLHKKLVTNSRQIDDDSDCKCSFSN